MTFYLKNGTSYRVTSKEGMNLYETLPPGNYTIEQDLQGNFYLEQIVNFEIPSKLYGNTTKHTDRIINTFLSREVSTGVLLNGEKGSGKTLLAKNIASELAKQNIPTIVINQKWTSEGFFKLLQEIEQPCAILFDEFEKVYDESEDQEKILTLLDGVFGSHKLYILTCNDKYRVNYHMRNRPGRIYYLLDFSGLEEAFIIEYCEENLNNKTYISQICKIANLFSDFNFDMLKALVEEMNRYDESPNEVISMLNIKLDYDREVSYDVDLKIGKNAIPETSLGDKTYHGNPLLRDICIGYYDNKDNEDEDWKICTFKVKDLSRIENGKYIFETDNNKLTLTKVVTQNQAVNYDRL